MSELPNEFPMATKTDSQKETNWSAIRGELAVYLTFCMFLGLTYLSVEILRTMRRDIVATDALTIAVNRLIVIQGYEIDEKEGLSPSVMSFSMEQQMDQNSLQKVP